MEKTIGRNAPCWCGSGKKYKNCCLDKDRLLDKKSLSASMPDKTSKPITRKQADKKRIVPEHIARPDYALSGRGESGGMANCTLTDEELSQMRLTCRAARRVLDKGIKAVRPGVTTDYIDSVVHEECIAEGGYPSPLNYCGFPRSVCTSVNEVICHGIPDDRPLENGDIVNIDVTLFLNGFHGDCSETVAVGEIDQDSAKLLRVTHESMMRGIDAVRPGGMIRDIGCAIAKHVKPYGYGIVRSYCGHGIGKFFHTDPTVPHYYDSRERTEIRPGMIFTVEPMINMGTWKSVLQKDGWTAVTADLKRSAQFEHTILVTADGVEILTLPD